MLPISVCIITKNEEKRIGQCLAPLAAYPFEIIVVDTGSTDRTKEIARKYTDKIYDFPWINDFSAARNFSLQKASHNYVLIIDSDEFLIDIDLDAIEKAVSEHPRAVGMLLRNNYYDSNGMPTNYPDRVERLFHKRYYHYIFTIHEQVADSRTDRTDYERYNIPLVIDHAGYQGSREEMRKKVERNNTLLLGEVERNPDNPYFYFQIGQSYNSIEDYENSYLWYKKAFALPLNPDELWVQVMATAFINAMTHTGRAEEARAFFEPIYDDFANDANFYCSMGVIYLNINQPLKAMMEFVKAVQCPNAREEGANTYIPYYNMGLVNEMLGNLPSAVSFYQKCGSYPLATTRLAELGITGAK